ncbi:hypothetical protein INS49_006592 [Diaporthe citri]|uniref:uncharacterized protein n=1 Tax=Diaporthe citri TaxID=83186 RepID=UPI001C803E02|nr:uncharacterized protein INS49_006592 [Diaporthe citri]KAG6364987.1 hypothetical protein INS49_006592 [Diaporthe citri]
MLNLSLVPTHLRNTVTKVVPMLFFRLLDPSWNRAGTAGLVIANRLSEDPRVTVAVVEAGDDVRNDPVVASLNFSFSDFNTSINWQYTSVPQANLGDRAMSYRAGKAIGGSSIVNGFVVVRGDKAQYDAWEDLGNKGWNWDTVFASFKAGEQFIPPTEAQVVAGATYDPNAHGTSGLLTISFPFDLSNSSYHSKATESWKKLGLEPIKDLNSGHSHGTAMAPCTADRDISARESSATAYYQPFGSRKNLKILKGTVSRVTWGRNSGNLAVADGVEYLTPTGKLVKIGVRRDAIISASVYRSPLILESSGVGNPKILKKLGITTKVSLPGVGESFQDHNAMGMAYATKDVINGRLPFAVMVTADDVFGDNKSAIVKSSRAQLASWAKIASKASGGAISEKAFLKRYQVQHDLIFRENVTIAEIFPTNGGTNIIQQFWASLPFSYGSIHLGAANKIDEPVIDPKLATFDFDVQTMASLAKLSREVYRLPPLSGLVTAELVPGESTLSFDAAAQWTAYVKGNMANAMHAIGTCAMLPRDLGGVVDARVKVHGTKNVRVVDASIIPMQLSGHTMGPVYAVAERAAALIKEDWK